jgi:hypothetical protein
VYELLALQDVLRRVLQQLMANPDDGPLAVELRELLGQMLRLLD